MAFNGHLDESTPDVVNAPSRRLRIPQNEDEPSGPPANGGTGRQLRNPWTTNKIGHTMQSVRKILVISLQIRCTPSDSKGPLRC
eukprot:583024-Rhodomonas_salina.1